VDTRLMINTILHIVIRLHRLTISSRYTWPYILSRADQESRMAVA